jgi:uncharacterized protein YbjT (DUF2867 family)
MTKIKIAVAGATGRAGRHVVDVLNQQGHDVVKIARSEGVDVITGEGLAEALEGVDVIIDVATGPSPEEGPATEFFTTAARNLQRSCARLIVAASIVGIERFEDGYGKAKVAHERALREGPIPVRIVRATQFHELVPMLMQWGRRDGVVEVPYMRTQIVAARAVAERLAEIATADAAPELSEIAGPREESLVELATLYARKHGDDARVEGVHGDPLNESGGLLPGPDAVVAGPTFEEWLATEG